MGQRSLPEPTCNAACSEMIDDAGYERRYAHENGLVEDLQVFCHGGSFLW